jgi:hypothetical protein
MNGILMSTTVAEPSSGSYRGGRGSEPLDAGGERFVTLYARRTASLRLPHAGTADP